MLIFISRATALVRPTPLLGGMWLERMGEAVWFAAHRRENGDRIIKYVIKGLCLTVGRWLRNVGTMLALCWAYVGLCWAYAGPCWAFLIFFFFSFFCFFLACFLLAQLAPAPSLFCLLLLASSFLFFFLLLLLLLLLLACLLLARAAWLFSPSPFSRERLSEGFF